MRSLRSTEASSLLSKKEKLASEVKEKQTQLDQTRHQLIQFDATRTSTYQALDKLITLQNNEARDALVTLKALPAAPLPSAAAVTITDVSATPSTAVVSTATASTTPSITSLIVAPVTTANKKNTDTKITPASQNDFSILMNHPSIEEPEKEIKELETLLKQQKDLTVRQTKLKHEKEQNIPELERYTHRWRSAYDYYKTLNKNESTCESAVALEKNTTIFQDNVDEFKRLDEQFPDDAKEKDPQREKQKKFIDDVSTFLKSNPHYDVPHQSRCCFRQSVYDNKTQDEDTVQHMRNILPHPMITIIDQMNTFLMPLFFIPISLMMIIAALLLFIYKPAITMTSNGETNTFDPTFTVATPLATVGAILTVGLFAATAALYKSNWTQTIFTRTENILNHEKEYDDIERNLCTRN